MDKDNVEHIGKTIREHNLEISNQISLEFLCTFCNKILIDACYGPCGCRYCKECITNYLKKGSNICPGTTENCKEQLLNSNSNIQLDGAINIRISRLVVKCPNLCSTSVQLKLIGDHLSICDRRSLSCPYHKLGCVQDRLLNDKVAEHLIAEIDSHTKLLLDWMVICENDKESLKREIEKLKSDSNDLKEKTRIDGERTENVIRELQKKEKENTLEIEMLGDEMMALKNQYRSLKEDLKAVGNKESDRISYCRLSRHIEVHEQELNQLKEIFQGSVETQETVCQNFKPKLEEISNASDILKMELLEKMKLIENTSIAMKENVDKMQKIIDQYDYGVFVWKIENWSELKRQAQNESHQEIYSRSFYTHKNGHKMCLKIYPNGDNKRKGTHLSLYFYIMRGPFDDILQWPFKHDVELSLMNQQTGVSQLTVTATNFNDPNGQAWIKPISKRNKGYGYPTFFELDKLSNNSELCYNNQIFIKCSTRSV